MGFYKQGRRGPKRQGLKKTPLEKKTPAPRSPEGALEATLGINCGETFGVNQLVVHWLHNVVIRPLLNYYSYHDPSLRQTCAWF